MKKSKLSKVLLSMVAVTSLASCNTQKSSSSNNSSNKNESSDVGPVESVIVSNVDAKHEFVLFDANKAKSSSAEDGFYDRTQTYKVGDDNNFNVKPELTVLDAQTYLPVSASLWEHDFDISVKLENDVVGKQYYSVVDARNCDIKFTEAAVGKKFTVSVCPGGIAEEKVSRFTKSIEVEVVDGYNVYDAKELGYFDTREANSTEDSFDMENGQRWQCKWTEFKSANGMDPNKHPAALLLQKDIKVTTADLPSNFFYSAADAAAAGDARAEGSLFDWAYLYLHTIDTDITLDGNYFELDLSAIPLVTREDENDTPVGGVISHAAAFKAIRGNNVKFQNINMSGNAKNATKDSDNIYGGGFIFVKAGGCTTFTAYNMIATKFFITVMSERQHYPDSPKTAFLLDSMKCYNNYNSFLYNWGASMHIKNCSFTNCGGPVMIQDHSDTNDFEAEHGMVVLGNPSSTIFEDCDIRNYVAGSEAWFKQFPAAEVLIPEIKGASDLLLSSGLPKCFITNENHEGKSYQALATAGQASLFNFIVLNKYGGTQDISAFPVCGSVKFIESNKAITFDYRQPDKDPVAQAYAAYATNQNQDTLNALAAAAIAQGVEINTNPQSQSDVDANMAAIMAYLAPICTPHETLRGVNGAGAPVFDFGYDYDLVGYDGQPANAYLQDLPTIVAEQTGGAPARYAFTNDQKTNLPNEFAIYYTGMMLVFGLTPYVA